MCVCVCGRGELWEVEMAFFKIVTNCDGENYPSARKVPGEERGRWNTGRMKIVVVFVWLRFLANRRVGFDHGGVRKVRPHTHHQYWVSNMFLILLVLFERQEERGVLERELQ